MVALSLLLTSFYTYIEKRRETSALDVIGGR